MRPKGIGLDRYKELADQGLTASETARGGCDQDHSAGHSQTKQHKLREGEDWAQEGAGASMTVLIRGILYPSVKAAAEALGVTINAIYSALARGNIDTVGTGKSQPQPVDLDGITFPSIRSASLALGFKRTYLTKALTSSNDRVRNKIAAALAAYKEKKQ